MKIKFYGYNTFVVIADDIKLVVDPGCSFSFLDFFRTILPKQEWHDITHIIVTHGDPDHFWYTDLVAKKSNASVICNEKMVKLVGDKRFLLGPRDRGLAFTTLISNIETLGVNETIEVNGVEVTGLKGLHGPLPIKIGPFKKIMTPGPNERVGFGEMVFKFKLAGKTLVNFGDTYLLEHEWDSLKNADVLMIPIGGYNTMDTNDAVKAIANLKPKTVIPCHYNCPALFSKCYNYVDTEPFRLAVEELGVECRIMNPNDEITI